MASTVLRSVVVGLSWVCDFVCVYREHDRIQCYPIISCNISDAKLPSTNIDSRLLAFIIEGTGAFYLGNVVLGDKFRQLPVLRVRLRVVPPSNGPPDDFPEHELCGDCDWGSHSIYHVDLVCVGSAPFQRNRGDNI